MNLQVYMGHCLWAIIFVLNWNLVMPQVDSKDLHLTFEEKTTLDKFKQQVINVLPEEFMKSDFYLIRWLRARNWDIPAAKTMLFDNLKWRKENKIKSILQEDWSDLEQDFPASFSTTDKMSRPIITMEMGDWDFRAAVLTGKAQRLNRYLIYTIERYVNSVFEAQAAGRNVTRVLVLVDLEGFSLRKHACPLCIPILIRWTATMESYYPQFTNEIIVINAPTTITVPFNSIKPLMSQDTRDQFQIFGTDKQQWVKYLDSKVDRSQRTQRYGGTKPLLQISS
ncbi:SEC14-like protein 4 [Orchesella cincta]|uniref:SEC14-like protein 4 n=1 Tax=Orchesella cincta TaxID=48709 RepID=A0A1D2MFE5_ORCCI|nr:SEC14-like protein 4 [Orchesella cincta]